jgi:CDP-diacylglycerol--glycerol-3-phosphate 3-phosphatidyltransferase
MQLKSISGRIGAGGKWIVDSLVVWLSNLHINPNVLTLVGLLINIFAMVLFAKGIFLWAALVILFAGLFDIVDGEVARRTQRVTKFGAFFDSVIDRYSDLLLLLGLIIWYAKINRIFYVGLTGLVLIGSVLTSYTRARAESLIPACKVGFLERPERVVLLIIGSLVDRMPAVLWVMAILSNWTVSQRIWYTWREASAMERRATSLLCAHPSAASGQKRNLESSGSS